MVRLKLSGAYFDTQESAVLMLNKIAGHAKRTPAILLLYLAPPRSSSVARKQLSVPYLVVARRGFHGLSFRCVDDVRIFDDVGTSSVIHIYLYTQHVGIHLRRITGTGNVFGT